MDCCICKAESKYKCPECGYRTCSLDCCKSHKLIYGCSGISKPLKYIATKAFTETHLRKDMNFLQGIIKNSDLSYKLVAKLSRTDTRKRFSYLISECKNRGISLKQMPKAMSRHSHNTSLFDKQEKLIKWHIEWKFLHKPECITCETSGNKEDSKMLALVTAALEKFRLEPIFVLNYPDEEISSLRVFYLISKRMKRGSTVDLYREVSLEKTLMELLPRLSSDNPIIEYPCFYIGNARSSLEVQINS